MRRGLYSQKLEDAKKLFSKEMAKNPGVFLSEFCKEHWKTSGYGSSNLMCQSLHPHFPDRAFQRDRTEEKLRVGRRQALFQKYGIKEQCK